MLHNVPAAERPSKTVRETEAEAVAFIVCLAAGLEPGTAAADYIQVYRGDRELLAASLERIQKTACAIIEAVEEQEPSERPAPEQQPASAEAEQERPQVEPPVRKHFLVDPDELARGTFEPGSGRRLDQGVIDRSDSADCIADRGSVRTPFRFRDFDWVATKVARSPTGRPRAEAYRLIPVEAFAGESFTYTERAVHDGDPGANIEARVSQGLVRGI